VNNLDCLFCKIANKEIPSTAVYEDSKVFAFRDIDPQAPCHILIIPKMHIDSALEIDSDNADVISHIFVVAAEIAKKEGIDKNGYRIVTNIGEYGGQSVKHLHYHMLGGRLLAWPPG